MDAWTADELAAAFLEANALARHQGRTPTEAWRARQPVTPAGREAVCLEVEQQQLLARAEKNVPVDAPPDHWRDSAIDCLAIPRALVEHGHLVFRRRRIPLTVNNTKSGNNYVSSTNMMGKLV